jgi:GLPGLI family protein
MKKIKISISILTLFSLTGINTYAQETEQTLVRVQYNFIHIQDTTQRDKPHIENMMLLAGKNASVYMSYDRVADFVHSQVERQEYLKKGFTNQEINEQNRAKPASNKTISYIELYFFAKEQKYYYKSDICINGCMVQAETDKIDWKIKKDTLNFSGTRCQMATANYKGRNWIAWFAPELPFQSGPWKLQGLPGLIIEAYDAKKEVQFKFAGIEKVKEGDLVNENAKNISPQYMKNFGDIMLGLKIDHVGLPPQREVRSGGSIQVTEKEFEKLRIENDKDPIAFRNAQLQANGMGQLIAIMAANPAGRGGAGGGRIDANGNVQVTQTITTKAPAPAVPKNVINNPIELPEKK